MSKFDSANDALTLAADVLKRSQFGDGSTSEHVFIADDLLYVVLNGKNVAFDLSVVVYP